MARPKPIRQRLGARPGTGTLTGPLRASRLRWPRKRRTAFILSGGGSLGAIQVGMLRALFEAAIWPDLILGCSVGSINGAGYAADPSMRGIARLERIWRRLASGDPDLMPAGRMPLAIQLARKGEALHDPAPLETLLTEEPPGGALRPAPGAVPVCGHRSGDGRGALVRTGAGGTGPDGVGLPARGVPGP